MRILCATDLLPKSEPAIERAGMLADELGADLTLLHVVGPTADSGRVLEQALQMGSAHMKARAQTPMWRSRSQPNVIVRAGNPARLIIETLEQLKARLLVLGPHRKRPVRDTVEGTIAEKVLVTKRCPLLIVRGEPRASYERALLALDLTRASASAVRAAQSLVLAPDSQVKIVHAYDTPHEGMLHYAGVWTDSITRYSAGWKREAADAVRALLHSEGIGSDSYEIAVEEGQPAPAILRAAEVYAPDLIVMGTRGRGRIRRALLGSVANRVLHDLSCDALIIPEGSFREFRRKDSRHARMQLNVTPNPVYTATVALQAESAHRDPGALEPVHHEQSAKHPEYPLERLCTHMDERFQLAFARRAQQLLHDREDVGLVTSHQGLTIRAETEEAIDAAVKVLTGFYGSRIRTGPPTIRYHNGTELEQPWMALRIECQPNHVEAVNRDLIGRDATIVSCEPDLHHYTIQARSPLARLIGYRAALQKLTSGSAQYVMSLSHYAPVETLPPDGDAA